MKSFDQMIKDVDVLVDIFFDSFTVTFILISKGCSGEARGNLIEAF